MQSIQFTCTSLAGTGKQGILPKDADGYYTMPIGALNSFNNTGDYYPYEAAKSLFTDSSILMRRISTGALKGEMGHPKPLPNQSLDSFANRVMTIEETKVCSHFGEIWLDFDNIKDETGKPIVAIMAKVAPSGPMGPSLERSFENRREDVCFSIRAFTEDRPIGGVKHRALRQIVTWDCVCEPGISVARKYRSPTLESFTDTSFTRDNIVNAVPKLVTGVAMEHNQALNADLLSILGWSSNEKPSFIKW